MNEKHDSPEVYLPPPVIYVFIFVAAIFLQKKFHIDDTVFHFKLTKGIGILFIVIAFGFLVTSLTKFFKTKNTVLLIKPAASLQINGVYAISRNPMYVGLAFAYLGITCFAGNWWNIILFPLLIAIVRYYVIQREEQYLQRAFGDNFLRHKKRVRRWL